MADFCHECSMELFGQDFGDLANLLSEEQRADGFVVRALCEGCGPIFVDHKGKRVD